MAKYNWLADPEFIRFDPVYVFLKKHYCPECTTRMSRKRLERIIPSHSVLEIDYFLRQTTGGGGARDNTARDVRLQWYEFECPKCKFRITIDKLKEWEQAHVIEGSNTNKTLAQEREQAIQDHYVSIANDAGFQVVYYGSEKCFNNIVLDLSQGTLMLRFMRDQGHSSCKVGSSLMPPEETWVDYNALVRMIRMPEIDLHKNFDALFHATLAPANTSALDALTQLTEDRELYAKTSHAAIAQQRKHSPTYDHDR